ncbi:hypothetical protein JCM10207_000167 [Rhodosporidiobolus poonsookiae]
MLFKLALAALPALALAAPAQGSERLDAVALRVRDALNAVKPDLEKRQSSSDYEAVSNYSDLLYAAMRVQSTDSECRFGCEEFTDSVSGCSDISTSSGIVGCACTSNVLELQSSCANCLGDDEQLWSRSFEELCAGDFGLSSAVSRSLASTTSDPFNGLGTARVTLSNGDVTAVTIPTYNPTVNYFTRTNTGLDTSLRNGGDLPTSTSSGASADSTLRADDSQGAGTVAVRVGAAVVAGALAAAAVMA